MKWTSAAPSSEAGALSESLARGILDALQAHVAVLDRRGRIILINAAWRRFARENGLARPGDGLGSDYLAACDASAARGDSSAREVAQELRALLSGERSHFHIEYPCHSPAQVRWFELHAAACTIGEGAGAVLLHVDLTQRRQTEMALTESEARYREESLRIARILELSKDAICTMDREGRFVTASAAAERLWGVAPATLVGTSVFDLVAEPERDAARAALGRLLTGCDTQIVEIRCVHADGRTVDVMWTAQWSDVDRQIFAVARDVTALRTASREKLRLARRLTSMLEQIHDGFFLLDDGWHFRYVNRRAEQLMGYSRADLIGRVYWDVYPAVVGMPIEEHFRRAVADRQKVTFEVTYAGRRSAVHAYPTRQGLAVYFLDVTERHRAVEALRRAASTQAFIVRVQQELSDPRMGFETLLATICARAKEMTAAHGAVVDLRDDDGRLVTRAASEGHQHLLGAHHASAASTIAAPIRDEADVFGALKVFSDRVGAFEQSDVANLQILAESLCVVLQRLRARRDLERVNRAQQLLSLSNLAQARVEDEAELLREICRLAVDVGGYRSVSVVSAGPGGTVSSVAVAGVPLSQKGASILAGDPATEVLHHREPRVFQRLQEAAGTEWATRAREAGACSAIFLPLQDGKSALGVLCLYASEPNAFVGDELHMLHDMAGDLAFGIRHIRTQRERRRLEQAVITVAAEVSATNAIEFFERLCASMAQALESPATFVARIVRHSGTPRLRTLAGVVDGAYVPSFEYDCRGTPCQRLLEEDEVVVQDGLSEGGVARTMGLADARSCVGRALRDAKGAVIGVLVVMRRHALHDVDFVSSLLRIFAARATAELARRQTDLRLREQATLLDQAKDAIVLRGLDGRIRYWNKGAERLFGWTSEEATAEGPSTIALHDDPDALADAVHEVLTHDEWSGQMEKRHRDGRLIPTEAHWTLVRDIEGRPQSILAINTDISRRLAVESQLRQSQRLESVGQLTGGVAHDFNNLLTVILGNAELLAEQLGRNPDLQELAEMIRSAAQRGADLTHRLLAFARRQNLNPQPIDVGTLVNGVATLLRRTVPESIRIERDTAADLWPCSADAAQLEAAILNLSLNARDAMPRGGRLIIRSRNQRLVEDDAERPEELLPGDYVRISVIDNGIGITPENLPRVIEPFFTTKPVGKGTGLGLSMVYGFARQSQGHLLIESSPDRGTTVALFLPRADAVRDAGSASPPPLRGGTESILLAEDDPLVRRFAEDQLGKLGYDVIAVEDGSTALRVLSSDVRVDLLFTDVVMPGGIGGPELVEAARRIRPGLRALYSSGYTEDAMDHLEPAREALLLRKPYRRIELAHAVRAALEGRVQDS